MHQVRYFLAVCESLNFTRAAKACNVAQPSLTKAIRKLEEELGGPLFRRERSRTHLTELGQLVRPHLERVLASAKIASVEAEGFLSLQRASLKLGVMSTINPQRVIPLLDQLRRRLPKLDLELEEARGQDLVEKLLEGELAVALIGLPDYPERLDSQPLFRERYTVAFRKGHRFEAMTAVPLAALDKEDYVLRTHCEFSDHMAARGLDSATGAVVRYSSEREDWAQAMVLAGLGCSIMPEFLPVMPGLTTRVLVEPEVERCISLVSVAGRRYSPAVEVLLRTAAQFDWDSATAA